jgi:hypothetical protein
MLEQGDDQSRYFCGATTSMLRTPGSPNAGRMRHFFVADSCAARNASGRCIRSMLFRLPTPHQTAPPNVARIATMGGGLFESPNELSVPTRVIDKKTWGEVEHSV